MKARYLTLVMAVMAMMVAPVLAGPPDKYVASLELEGERYGQAIFNTSPEEFMELVDEELVTVLRYELEVEIEECMDLAAEEGEVNTVPVYVNGIEVGSIDVDEFGNGKATFYVEEDPAGSEIIVEGEITLTSSDWREWVKGPGKK